ncbi:hypothetical protein BGZ50_008047 [Haplosporangium sp. Z 11]|nr:hypothetical protein BGZ50_008047 [Haplosporangium sp. Z 11]
MLEIVASLREQEQSPVAHAQYEALWACLPKTWSKVIPDCIRNCFVHVLIVPETLKQLLRGLGVETKADQIKNLQKEFDFIDEEEVDKDGDLDWDFEPLASVPQGWMVFTTLQSRIAYGHHDGYSSIETGPSKKNPSAIREITQSIADITEDVLASDDLELQYDLQHL